MISRAPPTHRCITTKHRPCLRKRNGRGAWPWCLPSKTREERERAFWGVRMILKVRRLYRFPPSSSTMRDREIPSSALRSSIGEGTSASRDDSKGVISITPRSSASASSPFRAGVPMGESCGIDGVAVAPLSRMGPLKNRRAQYHQYTAPMIATVPTTNTA